MERRANRDISLSKFIDFLVLKSYSPVSVYRIGDKVVFIEVRTPKVQRSFVIHVDEKYSMRCNNDRYRSFEVFSKDTSNVEMNIQRVSDYIKEIKGVLLTADILSITNDKLVLLKNNETLEVYTFDGDVENEDDSFGEGEEGVTDRLEKDSERLISVIEEAREEKEKSPEATDEAETQIELEFVDDAGDSYIEEENGSESDSEVFVQPTFKIKSIENRIDNSIPENITGSNVDYGILYFSMDLSMFYQRLKTGTGKSQDLSLEEEIIASYDTMDDNETDMRSTKLDEIQELCSKISSKAKLLVDGYQKREMDLKSQVLKLSAVLEKAENLKNKVSDKKFVEEKPNVDRLYNQTKTSLYDLNVEIAQNKDCINDLLNIYITSLTYLSTDEV